MEVNKELLENVAKVARLKLSENEIEEFIPQVKEILDSFQILNEINTDNVKPSFQPVPIKNKLREDIPKDSLSVKEALKNTTQKQNNYFKGPKAV